MRDYLVPFAAAETEFAEKRSRFLGQLRPVETQEAAQDFLTEIRSRHRDARHNCWCYLLREGDVVRCSDDGEPQGTAGQPMLEVFRKAGVYNLCFVSTRYFGGVLLGTGGLLRAYTRSARETLAAAGCCRVLPWRQWKLLCPYPLLERIKTELAAAGGRILSLDYAAEVRAVALVPPERETALAERLLTLSAGQMHPDDQGITYQKGEKLPL